MAVASVNAGKKGNTKWNAKGYTFVVRESSTVSFDPAEDNACVETLYFPDTKPQTIIPVLEASEVRPCAVGSLEDLPSGISAAMLTVRTDCNGPQNRWVTVQCLVNGLAVSFRQGTREPQPNAMWQRIGCEEQNQQAALLECANSVKTMAILADSGIKFTFPPPSVMAAPPARVLAEGAAKPDQAAPAQPAVDAVKPVQAAPAQPAVDVAPAQAAVTVVDPVKAASTVPAASTDEENRALTMISGRNQIGYHFEILDGGVVTFIPRVGLECRETFTFPPMSSSDKFNAALWSTFVPCKPPQKPLKRADIDPSWDIVKARVDCTDDLHISITCAVVFGKEAMVQMSREAKVKASSDPQYLSSRIGCGAPGDNEIVECANIAANYLQMKAKIPTK